MISVAYVKVKCIDCGSTEAENVLMDINDIAANPAIKHFNLNIHIKSVNLELKTES